MNQSMLDKYLALLPSTIPQIKQALQCSDDTVYKWMGRLRDQQMLHIGGWISGQKGAPAAVYVAGDGVDLEKPTPGNRQRIELLQRISAQAKGEDTVSFAVRTQPNSVFSMWQSL